MVNVKDHILGVSNKVLLEITKQCNCKCKHCFTMGGNKLIDEMDTGQLINVFNKLMNNFEFITISGGEPTLRTDLINILEKADNKKGAKIGLFTNGVGITDYNIKILTRYINQFIISIDGNEKNHNYLRGVQNYDTVINALNLFKKYSASFSIQMMVNNDNWHDLDHIVNLAIKYKAFGIKFSHIGPQGKALRYPNLFIDMEKKENLLKYICKLRRETSLVIDHNFILKDKFINNKKSFFKIYMHITPDGNMLPYYGLTNFNIGNILNCQLPLNLPQIINVSEFAKNAIIKFHKVLQKTYNECELYAHSQNIIIPYEEILLKNSM